MALTATAPPAIMQEITTSLLLSQPVTVQLGLNRPNIYLSVGKKWSVSVSELLVLMHPYTVLVIHMLFTFTERPLWPRKDAS